MTASSARAVVLCVACVGVALLIVGSVLMSDACAVELGICPFGSRQTCVALAVVDDHTATLGGVCGNCTLVSTDAWMTAGEDYDVALSASTGRCQFYEDARAMFVGATTALIFSACALGLALCLWRPSPCCRPQ
jgi:hypothetical protein